MKACIIAWSGLYKDNVGFKTVNIYKYGPIRNIEESNIDVANEMVEDFKSPKPDFNYNHIELVTEDNLKDKGNS